MFAALVVSLSGVAYASDTAAAEVPRAPKVKTGRIGDTLRLRGLDTVGDTVKVTVRDAVRIRAAGLYGVSITVRNVRNSFSQYPFDHTYRDLITRCVVLTDTKGRRHRAVRAATDEAGTELPGQINKVAIPLGEWRSGWVYFALAPKRPARAFRYTPDRGWGYDTGRWLLK